MADTPIIEVEATFLRLEEGGREHLPGPPFTPQYRPHLVVRRPDISQADLQDNLLTEDYLGAAFLEGPSEYTAGQAGRFLLDCMYPKVNYDALCVGATFTICEGSHIVGFGTVLAREEPVKAAISRQP